MSTNRNKQFPSLFPPVFCNIFTSSIYGILRTDERVGFHPPFMNCGRTSVRQTTTMQPLCETNKLSNYLPNKFPNPRPPVFCNIFIILWASRNCLIRRFTSCTSMPEPVAMRFLPHSIDNCFIELSGT